MQGGIVKGGTLRAHMTCKGEVSPVYPQLPNWLSHTRPSVLAGSLWHLKSSLGNKLQIGQLASWHQIDLILQPNQLSCNTSGLGLGLPAILGLPIFSYNYCFWQSICDPAIGITVWNWILSCLWSSLFYDELFGFACLTESTITIIIWIEGSLVLIWPEWPWLHGCSFNRSSFSYWLQDIILKLKA